MKLTRREVELLVLSINPLVEMNKECNPERARQLGFLQDKLEKYHEYHGYLDIIEAREVESSK
jgi:hypothetical protein